MKYGKLKGVMRERGITQEDLAKVLGRTPQSVNAKLNGRGNFTVPEAQIISEYLEIKNPAEIFFNSNIPNTQQN